MNRQPIGTDQPMVGAVPLILGKQRQDNWAAYLPLAEFTHNNWPNETTHKSLFFLLMGYNPRADWTDRPSPIPQVA